MIHGTILSSTKCQPIRTRSAGGEQPSRLRLWLCSTDLLSSLRPYRVVLNNLADTSQASVPRADTDPAFVPHLEILRALLSDTIILAINVRVLSGSDSPHGQGFTSEYTEARVDASLLFSKFKYHVGCWPPALVTRLEYLVSNRNKCCRENP